MTRASTYIFGGNRHIRPATEHVTARQKFFLVTSTYTDSYMNMQTPTESPSRYHENTPVHYNFTQTP